MCDYVRLSDIELGLLLRPVESLVCRTPNEEAATREACLSRNIERLRKVYSEFDTLPGDILTVTQLKLLCILSHGF